MSSNTRDSHAHGKRYEVSAKLVTLLQYSWKPLIATLLLALAGEVSMHSHLNVYDWLIACLYSALITMLVITPTWICVLNAQKHTRISGESILLVFMLTPAISVIALLISNQLPRDSWSRTQDAPERLVKLVDMEPFGFFDGTIFAESQSGKTYVYTCSDGCQWKEELLPKPTTKNAGPIACNQEEGQWAIKPIAFFRTTQMISAKSCGADYSITTHFALDDQGAVWSWQQFDSFFKTVTLMFGYVAGGVIIGIMSSVFLTIERKNFWKNYQMRRMQARSSSQSQRMTR